jgi:hypothetical protein
MNLEILDVLREVDLTCDESIVKAATAIYYKQTEFCSTDDRLTSPEYKVDDCPAVDSYRTFDNYDVGTPNLKEKFLSDVAQLLIYCARAYIKVV